MRRPAVARPPLGLRLVLHRGALGLALGGGLTAALALLGLVTGAYRPQDAGAPLDLRIIALLPLAAWVEELVFRRLVLEWSARQAGRWIGLALSAALFAALHARNPGFGPAAAVGVFLAGIWLGQLYLQHRRVICGTAAHLAWNLGISVVLGLPVSGIHVGGILPLEPVRDDLLCGGSFGPEASPLAWMAFGAAIVALEVHHRWRTHAR